MLDACSEHCADNSRKRFIEEKIPDWLTRASPHRRLALRQSPIAIADWYRAASEASHTALAQANKAAWLSRGRLDRVFAPLADIRQFAAPLLQKALKGRFGVELDVSQTYLRLYLPKGILVGYQVKTLSLLDAALRNFEKKEAAANYFDDASSFISQPDAFGHFNLLPINRQISISAFVLLCRELDIGGQYSKRLEALLLPKDAVAKAVLEYRVKTSQKDAFRAAVLLARMKGDIGAQSQASLLRLLDGVHSPAIHGYQLQIMSAKLTGIMVLAGDLERAIRTEPILVYIPDDPQHPIKEYPSTLAFKVTLTEQLRSTEYQRFFARFVAHEHRGAFFAALDQSLNVVAWHPPQPGDPQPAWRRTRVDNPLLRFDVHRVQGDPWQWLYQDSMNKIVNDARIIAVPTADEDRQSRWAFWDSVQHVASIVLQAATLVAMPFVPFLGELMLAYTAYQLLDDTFTGILDWTEGQLNEATAHLLAIAENIAQLGAFVVGGQVVSKLLQRSAFVETLKIVDTGAGRLRLWNPDLRVYERPTRLPVDSQPDELGLHQHRGTTVLPLDGKHYEVVAEGGGDGYRIRHPNRADAYQPRLTHNGVGAWAHEVERPMEWQAAQLFRRLGHSVAQFSDVTAARILAVSGIDEAVLRDLHVHSRRPPALLEDSIRRFDTDQQIQTFIAQLRSLDPAIYTKADPQMQEQLLLARGVLLPERVPGSGDPLRGVVEALDDQSLKKLLGDNAAFGDSLPEFDIRVARLRARMASWAEESRSALFEGREARFEHSNDEEVLRLRRVFPDLPKTIAEELWRNAGTPERLRLRNQLGISRQMAEETLFYLREVRLSRACEGLYLEAVTGPDTDRLALHQLQTLSGWSPQVRIEVRAGQFDGALIDSIGPAEAAIRKVLVRDKGRYQAFDSSGLQLHGLDDLCGAVQHALPDAQRLALGLPHASQDGELMQAVRRQPLLARAELRALFGQPPLEPGLRSPMGLAVGRSGYLLGGGDVVPESSGSTVQRLQRLYPTLSEEQIDTFRRELPGADPLLAVARLENQYLTLVNDLGAWTADVPLVHPLDGSTLSAEEMVVQRQRRAAFSEEIQASWRRQLTQQNRFDTHRFFSKIDILGDLPRLSADFSHISEFLLINSSGHLQAGKFLESFPGLQFLTMRGIRLDAFPVKTFQMRRLTVLSLDSCNLRLSEATAEGLAHMEGLEELDLRNNPLEVAPYVGHMKNLEELRLSRTDLQEVPAGLFDLEKLRYADLSGNRIVKLPNELFEVDDVRKVTYNFRDNPLNELSRENIAAYDENSSLDRHVLIQFDDGLDLSSDSESGSETESDDSGVGSSSEASDDEFFVG
ncbi:leucine-rich repeat domain-containing protein [Pseudomonas sp. PDM32]|uniref:dermonecrotic toxin domain-containing protein n=1 Tax=Pseudomonas sp. PDM32 TaxID=2854768 RepID=UPI001C4910DB|nr:DUF6543 domain-containing protein [Pseudomonas sp. PDM32]MBV7574073.1 leucine-rich repeat domain-containing protein [Pseudomonas sp. PDM32]